jgi:hypothetical protein
MSGISTITGQIVDTGVPDKSKAGGCVESPAGALDCMTPASLVTTIGYSVGWGTGYEGAWYAQDYDMFLLTDPASSVTGAPSLNPLVTGEVSVTEATINPGEEFDPTSTSYYYCWYSNGTDLDATLAFQDWLAAGTWYFTFSKSTEASATTGTIDIYAVCGATQTLIGTTDSSNTTALPNYTYTAPAAFQILVVQSSMSGSYFSISAWDENNWFTSPPPVSSGASLPPQGIVWSDVPIGDGTLGSGDGLYLSTTEAGELPGITVGISGHM